MILNESIDLAAMALRNVPGVSLNELIALCDRLTMLKGVAPVSPREGLSTCAEFIHDCNDVFNRLDDDGYKDAALTVRCIARKLLEDCTRWCGVAIANEDRKEWDRGEVRAVCVGRWESVGGKYWVELCRGRFDYSYTSNNSCGSVCSPFATNGYSSND